MIKSLLELALPLTLGFCITGLLWPGLARSTLLVKLFLAIGVGVGLTSCLFFAWAVLFGPAHPGMGWLEAALTLVLLVSFIASERRLGARNSLMAPVTRLNRLSLALLGILLLLLVVVQAGFFVLSWMEPHGDFDAWAIWNLRARFIFRDPAQWQLAFSNRLDWSFHADYPLLLTASVARMWLGLKSETFRAPMVIGWFFAFGSVGLIFAALYAQRTTAQAALGALLLAGTPWFGLNAAQQKADIPLAYFILAACATLSIYICAGSKPPGLLALSGMNAGLAGWTKNEGILFLAALMGIGLVASLTRPHRIETLKRNLPFLYGALIPVACLVYFKLALAPPNDILAGQTLPGLAAKIMDISRYGLILKDFALQIFQFGNWPVPLTIVLAAYVLLIRFRSRSVSLPAAPFLWVLLGAVLCGYALTYLITPHPLAWHLEYSLSRILLHLYPAFLFTLFIALIAPEEALQGRDLPDPGFHTKINL